MYSRGRLGVAALAGAVAVASMVAAQPATTEAVVEPEPASDGEGYGWRQAMRHKEQRSRPFALNRHLRGKWTYAELRAMVGKRPASKAPTAPGAPL